ncbi:hypothetical protein [Nostoc sp.]|uniref:hypothetical protein n=1 Tax=Nostoc sp. TaxID=1180 RepID=UPI002FF6A1AB
MVHLRDFSLMCPDIQNGDLLKAIEMAIPATAIEQAIASLPNKTAFTTPTGERNLDGSP